VAEPSGNHGHRPRTPRRHAERRGPRTSRLRQRPTAGRSNSRPAALAVTAAQPVALRQQPARAAPQPRPEDPGEREINRHRPKLTRSMSAVHLRARQGPRRRDRRTTTSGNDQPGSECGLDRLRTTRAHATRRPWRPAGSRRHDWYPIRPMMPTNGGLRSRDRCVGTTLMRGNDNCSRATQCSRRPRVSTDPWDTSSGSVGLFHPLRYCRGQTWEAR
jgi:hypothetical protein